MPEKDTLNRARKDAREGKSPSTQAGEFVREEIEHVKEGKHGARSPKQAIAIGLSKARRAGVKLPPPKSRSEKMRRQAERDEEKGQHPAAKATSQKRSRATTSALKRESSRSVSHKALSEQGRASARKRSSSQRSASAKKAARTRARNQK